MTRCLVVHVGPHKTGTTAIQVALHEHRDELATQGWNYPVAGRPATGPVEGHHALAWAMRGLHDVDSLDEWDRLAEELAASPHDHHVISAEAFARASESEIRAAFERVEVEHVVAVFYVRDRRDLLRSHYAQTVRFGDERRSFARFVRARPELADFDAMAATWRRALRHDAVIVRSYDDAVAAGTVVDDLSDLLGVRRLAGADRQLNVSPTAPDLVEALVENVLGRRPWLRRVPGVRIWARRAVDPAPRRIDRIRRRLDTAGATPVGQLVTPNDEMKLPWATPKPAPGG